MRGAVSASVGESCCKHMSLMVVQVHAYAVYAFYAFFLAINVGRSDSCQIQRPEIQAHPDLQNLDAIFAMPFSKLDFSDVNCKVPSQSDHSDFGVMESSGLQGRLRWYSADPLTDTMRSQRSHLSPTSFGVGTAAAGLRKASDFLFSIDSGKAWEDIQELFKTPAVLSKHGQDYEYWVSEADDTTSDLRRAKDILQDALAKQAPQPEQEKPETNQE